MKKKIGFYVVDRHGGNTIIHSWTDSRISTMESEQKIQHQPVFYGCDYD
jgi:hypothetical protein